MKGLQSYANKNRCVFVEFRAQVDPAQASDAQAQQLNMRAVSQFARKLFTGELVSGHAFTVALGANNLPNERYAADVHVRHGFDSGRWCCAVASQGLQRPAAPAWGLLSRMY